MSCKQLFFCVNILQFLAFGAAFFGSNNLELLSRFRTTFEQNIGLEDISKHEKVDDFTRKTSIYVNFLTWF